MSIPARVFVVHVWSQDSASRARARAADTEQPRNFDDPQALLAFLHAGTASSPAPATCSPTSPTQPPHHIERE
jgi:hypothetical protein